MKRTWKWTLGGTGVVAVTAIAFVAGRALAGGIPATGAMTYSGVLENAQGQPLTGAQAIALELWDHATAGAEQCEVPSPVGDYTLDPQGRFSIALGDACTAAVQANPDLWVQLRVAGSALPRTKLGAVAYAVEAGHATAADTTGAGSPLDDRIRSAAPRKAVVFAHLTASEVSTAFDGTGLGRATGAYAGWALCNGSNGTPNLTNRFVRASASGAGATGGNDLMAHTHAIDHDHGAFTSGAESGHTHSTPPHQHVLPIGWDSSNVFYGSDSGGGPIYGSVVITADRYTPGIGVGHGPGVTRFGLTQSDGAGTTGASSGHTHGIDAPGFAGTSGPASAADNRPAFHELVALMRL